MKENKNIDKLFETSYVIADYTQKLESNRSNNTRNDHYWKVYIKKSSLTLFF
jgi:hypothetical protein